MRKNSLLLGLLASVGMVLQANANLFTNGSFESPGSTLTSNYVGIGSGSQITGWTTGVGNGPGANVYYAHSGSTASWIPNAQSGNYCVQLDSSTGGAFTIGSFISQTVNLVAGQKYTLSFGINTEVGAGGGGVASMTLNISGAGYNTGGGLLYTASNLADVSRANAGWDPQTFSFTATGSGATTFKFADVPNNCGVNVSIDGVVLDQFVPEFSHWSVFAAFGVALIALRNGRRLLGLLARRRQPAPVMA